VAAAGALAIAGGIAALSAREVTLPGHRGAARLTSGFVPGRWDARFLVARGPASLSLPALPLRLTMTLAGPARVRASWDGGTAERALDAEASPWTLDLPRGGDVALDADATLRLHALRLERRAGPSPRFAALVVHAEWDRSWPLLTLAVIVIGLAAAALAGRGSPRAPAPSSLLPAVVAAVVLLSCLLQVLTQAQPQIVGDPGAYFDIAGRFRDALRAPAALGDSLYDLRPYAGLAFTGSLYGLLRLLRDAASTLYVAHALALAGAVFFLVRAAARAFGSRVAAITGALAALYPTFPVVCGIVQPEPFILLLWCLALDRLVASAQGDPPRRLVPAGLAFAVGLALHPQGIWYLLAAAALWLLPWLPALRQASVRRRAAAFALGVLPVAAATAIGESWAHPATAVLEERYGFFAYTVPYPLGFWLFLETDGWQGPVRLDETRYAREFEAARERGEIRGGLEAWRFTARFVAARAPASLRAILRNLHRLYRRPDNPFHRTWLLPYAWQVPWHQGLVVAFLLAAALLARGPAWSAVLPVAMLATTYPLYHIFNKYALPATPFLLLGAAVFIAQVWAAPTPGLALALAAAAIGAFVRPAALVLGGMPVPLARWGLLALQVLGLAGAFFWAARRWSTGLVPRRIGGVAILGLAGALMGSRWDDPSWRAGSVDVAEGPRQEIVLDGAGLDILRTAHESYLAFDLELPDGDPSGLRLEFEGGLVVPGRELQPTMPPFGLATARGGRDPRRFPQWWITPWRAEMSRDGRIGVTLRGNPGSRLAGDVGPDPAGEHHGLSLGQWPQVSVYRLMHEGEYRLPLHQPIDGGRRTSWRGSGRVIDGTYGVRLVALDDEAGGAKIETEPTAEGDVVVAIWARAGRSFPAEIVAPAGNVRFELGGRGPWAGSGGELRHVPTGEYEGWYLLRTRVTRAGPVSVTVRPRHEMLSGRKYFLPEVRPEPPVPADWAGLRQAPAARVDWARDTPNWKPLAVY
jgi:hypothetical protein